MAQKKNQYSVITLFQSGTLRADIYSLYKGAKSERTSKQKGLQIRKGAKSETEAFQDRRHFFSLLVIELHLWSLRFFLRHRLRN